MAKQAENYITTGPNVAIRPLRESDLPELMVLEQDPEVLRYITDGKPLPTADIEARLHKAIDFYQHHGGLGKFAVIDREHHDFLGWACLQPLDQTSEIEIGYRLHQKAWGRGIATETSQLLRDYFFDQLGHKRLVGVVRADNLASKRVLEKTGLQYIKEAVYYNTPVLYFALER